MISDEQIEIGKNSVGIVGHRHHEHNDCIRMAYEWLDAQVKTKNIRRSASPIKHIIEKWSGRYVSASDVDVAAWLHPDIKGEYPNFNISSNFTLPSLDRLKNIPEAGSHNDIGGIYSTDSYSLFE